ncbi:DUF4190 domain-containing protein [Sediminivirga luteola]|uniref:DUF4190 domain-containing protein n=1 Tax=Sediminivirga luteola TaxID=1774748 RepID=A0A8J2XJT9_9MICO|nr:DUF4190 domain-containing protein [Sediminivirga luteola]MCI2265302.1 DUF4190 domain-containing protein [Sediminivirga luteola]GGA04529.1 hypothetical protein GCM10011333_03750 [Sediminivirga luteola]
MSENPNYPAQPGQPNYGAPQGGYQPAPTQEDPGQTLGILALVFAFLAAPVGIILGFLSRKKSREAGLADNQLGKWGFILGIIFTIIGVLFWIAYIVFIVIAVNAAGTAGY